MANSQTDAKSLKRPRGLLKSKKGRNNAEHGDSPSSKRQKQAEEVVDFGTKPMIPEETEKSVTYEDWEDLKEIFMNALHNYKGPEPASCAPLLRGVMHECDRFSRNSEDPTSIYLKGQSSSTSGSGVDSPLAFATIQGYALYLMGALILEDPSIVTEGEPSDPAEYFEVVLNTFENASARWKGKGRADALDPWKARMEIVWGDSINGLAAARAEENEGSSSSFNAESAVAHFFVAQRCAPSIIRPVRDPGTDSSSLVDTETDLDTTSIITLTRNSALLEAGRGVIESTYREDDNDLVRKWCKQVLGILDAVSSTENDDEERRANFEALRGKCWLTMGALSSEACASDEDHLDSLETEEAQSSREELDRAVKFLSDARRRLKEADLADSDILKEVERSMGEAYMHLGNVTADEEKRESLYVLAKTFGVDVDLLGGDSDDEWKGIEEDDEKD
ncbi:hypothetical protein FRB96_002942 [Tulasnella sp. 330]|nr:hypothetical protein FRB96_002942 [Tulasnella sp. 330]